MIGETGFDAPRLLREPEYRLLAEAAVSALSGGSAAPFRAAIEREETPGRRELAAFAASSQGIAPLLATLPDAPSLPADVAAFLASERSASAARGARLKRTLGEAVTSLREAGVEVVALKGAALAFFHYVEPALRPMGDLDLLLREPRDLGRATEALSRGGWRPLFDTPRHRVFARPDERIARAATEDPENPVRLEIHTSFRLPVLGRIYDAGAALRAAAEVHSLDGLPVAIAAGRALLTHLLFHAAEDFAGNGVRGIQAYDFRLLAGARGPLAPEIREDPEGPSSKRGGGRRQGIAPLLYAADAIERLFPHTFDESFLFSISSGVRPEQRARAAALPPLRYTRPARGWTRALLPLVDGPVPRARFLLRTLFPSLGEVKANAAPDASGLGLAAAWARVFVGRAGFRRGGER